VDSDIPGRLGFVFAPWHVEAMGRGPELVMATMVYMLQPKT